MSKVALTYRDYAALPDDGKRYELYEGELVELTSPTRRHQEGLGGLHALLREHVRRHGLGRVLLAPFDVILSDITVFQPDLLFVAADRLRVLADHGVEGAPTLAVEILSPSTAARDRGRKQALYARHGVPFLWLVDPDAHVVEAYTLEAGAYRLAGRAAGATPASLPPFPTLEIVADDLWT